MRKLYFCDLFAGLGGFREGFENGCKSLNIKNECTLTCEIKKHAITVYQDKYKDDNLKKEDFLNIRKLNKENLKDTKIDVLLGGFVCFTAGHKVKTINGYKNIENITKNDLVLTHSNNYEKVIKTMKRFSNNIYNLKIYGSKEQEVTKEHPYYVIEKQKVWNNKEKQYIYLYSDPKWVTVENLIPNKHFIGININNQSKKINFEQEIDVKLKKRFNINNYNYKSLPFNKKEFYWFLGRFMADGLYKERKRKNKKNKFIRKVILNCSLSKNIYIENKLKKLEFKYTKVKKRNKYNYIFSNILLVDFIKKFIKNENYKKIPKEILDLPINLLTEFIKGYLSCKSNLNNQNSLNYNITTINEEFALDLQNIIHKVYKVAAQISYTKHHQYLINFKLNSLRKNYLLINNKLWFPVKKVEKTNLEKEVFNFEVEYDNSYTINNLIVHNCKSFSNSGKREGFNCSINGDLFFEITKILKIKKPKYFILENVDNLVIHNMKKVSHIIDKLEYNNLNKLEINKVKIGETFNIILNELKNLGYTVSWEVLNTKDFNLPQKRKRVFIVGILNKNNEKENLKENLINLKFKSKEKTFGEIQEKGLPIIDNEFKKKLIKHIGLENIKGKNIRDSRGNKNNLNIHSWKFHLKGNLEKIDQDIMELILKNRKLKRWKEKYKLNKTEFYLMKEDIITICLENLSINKNEINNRIDKLTNMGYLHPKENFGYKGLELIAGRLSFYFNNFIDPNKQTLTLTATDTRKNGVIDINGIRCLSKNEMCDLFGFDKILVKSLNLVSNNQVFDLFGNSLGVPIVEAITKRMLKKEL